MLTRVEARQGHEFSMGITGKELREVGPRVEVLGHITEVFQPKRTSKDAVAPKHY